MCDRHFLLLLTLFGIAVERKFPVPRQDLYHRFYGESHGTQMTREFWGIWKDADKKLHAPIIDDDLAQLHQRGYVHIFGKLDGSIDSESPILINPKAAELVQHYITDHIRAMASEEAPTPFP